MKHHPSRNVCFARDRYHLQVAIRSELLATSNQAGCENKFRRGIDKLLVKHQGYTDSHHKILPLPDGTKKVLRQIIIRFSDNTAAAVPSTKALYTEATPFKYHAKPDEHIPSDWLPEDYDVVES